MCNVRSGIADIAVHLAHDTDMLITVEQRIFLLALRTRSVATEASFVCFQAGIGEDDDQSAGVLVGGGDWNMLLCDELG